MRALKDFLLVSSGLAAFFAIIAVASAVLTATVASQLRSAKAPLISVTN